MAMRVRFGESSQLVQVGFAFQLDYPPPSGEGFPAEVYFHDLFLGHTRQGLYARGGVSSLSRVYGFKSTGEAIADVSVGNRPHLFSNAVTHNQAVYGSILQNLQLFGEALGFGSTSIVVPSSEKPMRHETYSGELIIDRQVLHESVAAYQFYDTSVDIRCTNGLLRQFVTLSNISPPQGVISGWNAGNTCTWCVDDLFDKLRGNTVHSLSAADGQLTLRSMSNFSLETSDFGLEVSYHMLSQNLVDGVYCEWDSSVYVPFQYPDVTIEPVVTGSYSTVYGGNVRYRYYNGKTNSSSPDIGRLFDSYNGGGAHRSFPVVLSDASSDLTVILRESDMAISSLADDRFLQPFVRDVYADFRSVATSSAFSASDAVKSLEGYLGINILQNLQKLPSLASAIPQLRTAVDLAGRLLARDLSFHTWKDIVSLVTSTHLQNSFQWQPIVRLITEYGPKLAATFSVLGLRTGDTVGYGSFRAELHNKLGRKDVTLLTRTKIVLSSDIPSWLTALTGVDALGLLPKPSNLWDLIPFTFLVNWFTGVGEAIRRAESTILLSTLPAYYVHTYTLTSPLTEDELVLLKASSDRSRAASLRIYVRDVTTFTPAPHDSHLDFGIPQGFPSYGTLGSLIWQLFFS